MHFSRFFVVRFKATGAAVNEKPETKNQKQTLYTPPMPYQHLEPLSKQLTIVIGLTVVGFMAFGLALSFYRNVLFDQTLDTITTQNQAIREGIDLGYGDLEYYHSSQYVDKEAKEMLGLVSPGEKVLIITNRPKIQNVPENDLTPTEQQEATYFELLRQMPTLEHWNLFLFNKEKIEELKRGV